MTAESTKRPLAPDLSSLDARSVRAWTEPMAVTPLGSGRYAVETDGGVYGVTLPDGTCNCPDYGYRGERCKHLRRVAIEVNRGEVPPPGKDRGTCAACGREGFVPEDGPALCGDCLYEQGDVVRDRETGDLLVVVRATDTPAEEWDVEGKLVTVADYETNEGYPRDDPVVEVVYPFSGDRDGDLLDRRRYAFPHSRLERRDEQFILD